MRVRVVKMRNKGVEVDRRLLREVAGTPGQLVILDVTDQGKNRPTKVARLQQGEMLRAELRDVQLVWLSDGRMTLTGYEQISNDTGQAVEYRQSWLITLDNNPAFPELPQRKVSPTR